MKRILEQEVMENPEDALELDKMSQKYIYVLNEAMARSALNMGLAGGKVLEIGVGPARIAIKLIKYNPNFFITGVDLSSNMLKIAQKNIKAAAVEVNKISLIKADAKILPFKTESFDLIISQNMLHHLSDPLPLLKEVKRLVKPSGAIIIRDVVRPATKFLAKLYASLFGLNYTKYMWKMYCDSMLAGFSTEEIEAMLKEAGLTDTKLTHHFLTHYGIEKKSPLNQKAQLTLQRFDFLREIILSFYK